MKIKFELKHIRHKLWWHGNFYPIPTIRFAWDRIDQTFVFGLVWLSTRFDMWFYENRKEDTDMKK